MDVVFVSWCIETDRQKVDISLLNDPEHSAEKYVKLKNLHSGFVWHIDTGRNHVYIPV